MKKKRNFIFIAIFIVIVLAIGVSFYYKVIFDENKLSIKEREWIDNNKSSIISVNVPNELNVFGYNGSGVFFDFLSDLEDATNININKNATSINSDSNSLGFVISKDVLPQGLLIYQDHYIMVSKTEDVITSYGDIAGTKVGVLADTLAYVSASYSEAVTYTNYDSRSALIDALKNNTVKYIIVPKTEYLDAVIGNELKIVYHFSDLTINYYLHLAGDNLLNSILTKFYRGWIQTDFASSYYEYTYNLYVEKLGLTQAEADTLTNKVYNYGFVSSTPYQTLTSSKYGGIAISYLTDFSKLSKVEFNYNKYKSSEALIKSFNNQKLDLMFNDTNIDSKFYKIYTNFNNKFYIISPLTKSLYLKNIKELRNDKVYMLENSSIYKYLSTIDSINIKAVGSERDLVKAAKRGEVIAIDANSYDYLVNKTIKGYSIRYSGYVNDNYSFKYVNNTDAFYKLFSAYMPSLDQNDLINLGLINYQDASRRGNTIADLARYTLVLVTGGIIVILYLYYRKHATALDTKIRKDDKLKFVDMLTSLKNRNYLSEKKDVWNNNTLYPQAMIVLDLNNVKYLNDTFGHEEGDKQIKAAANILIKTQPDNTEIMRTDGNEFTVYLVGYSEKQVLNYIKKLVKEFKDLPYEYGAAFGFSMIVDDLKLIDDAINEASLQMRDNKEIKESKDEEKGR